MKTIYQHASSAALPVNIEFDNVSLSRIAAMLHERYGVTINIATKSLHDIRYTGNFNCGDSWELLIHQMAEALSIEYKMLELRSFEFSVFGS